MKGVGHLLVDVVDLEYGQPLDDAQAQGGSREVAGGEGRPLDNRGPESISSHRT